MSKEKQNKKRPPQPAPISDRTLNSIFKYRPTSEDRAIKNLLSALNY